MVTAILASLAKQGLQTQVAVAVVVLQQEQVALVALAS
jgi:hypothetical protein